MTELIIFVLVCAVIFLLVKLYKFNRKFARLVLEKNSLAYQKRSSEVRLGKTVENIAPFFTEYPYDPGNFRFLGSPIDGISFNDDEVVFIEIKTGQARLSKQQHRIKSLVKDGKVKFMTFRANEKGVNIK